MKYSNIIRRLLPVLFGVFCFSLIGCLSGAGEKRKEAALRPREPEPREIASELREKSIQGATNQTNSERTTRTKTTLNEKKELRYLFHANGGMIGYFDDGTTVGCPRCDFCRSNILSMFEAEPTGKYQVERNGSIIINNSERVSPDYQQDNGWALINYHWNEKVPQH